MKKLRYDRLSEDLAGVVLRRVTDGEELFLEVNEAYLRELDRLLQLRDEAGATAPQDSAGSENGDRTGPSNSGIRTETEPTAEVSAKEESEEVRLDNVPKTAEDAVDAVKSWVAIHDSSPSEFEIAEAVDSNLRDRLVSLPSEIFDESWSGERRKGGGWLVNFTYLTGGQPRVAEWVIDDVKRTVQPLNGVAEELEWRGPGGSGKAVAPRRRPGRRRR